MFKTLSHAVKAYLNMCFKINRTNKKYLEKKVMIFLTDSPVCLDLAYFQPKDKTKK